MLPFFTNHLHFDSDNHLTMMRTQYRLIRAKTKQTEGTVAAPPPKSPNSNASDWASLFTELESLQLGYSWSGGVHDADDPSRIWLVDEYGYMSHSLEPITLGDAIKPKENDGSCPKCGERGSFIRMALVCTKHGMYGGI